jgi:hypothetical protein
MDELAGNAPPMATYPFFVFSRTSLSRSAVALAAEPTSLSWVWPVVPSRPKRTTRRDPIASTSQNLLAVPSTSSKRCIDVAIYPTRATTIPTHFAGTNRRLSQLIFASSTPLPKPCGASTS